MASVSILAAIVRSDIRTGVATASGTALGTRSTIKLIFTTLVPGCYSGRVPHVHFGGYPSLANITLATDNVLRDGVSLQSAAVTGSAALGYVATLQVGVSL